jgi:hypothetical protein
MYLIFIASGNATTGQPNKQTGRHNRHGGYLKFRTREERANYLTDNPHDNVYWCTCGKGTGRRFSLGMSLADYNEYLNQIPAMVKVDNVWGLC